MKNSRRFLQRFPTKKKKKNVRRDLLSFTTSDKSIHKTKNKKIKQTCFWEALQFFKLLQKILKNIRLEFSQFLPKFQNPSQSLTTISRINYLKKFLELETRETLRILAILETHLVEMYLRIISGDPGSEFVFANGGGENNVLLECEQG